MTLLYRCDAGFTTELDVSTVRSFYFGCVAAPPRYCTRAVAAGHQPPDAHLPRSARQRRRKGDPTENEALAKEMAEKGLILSEAPMGLVPQGRHFPRRNRIVSGISRAVIVIEAAARSGSLITARYALDQGREAMAAPGSPLDPRSEGCNELIRQGAALIRHAEDVEDVLGGPRSLALHEPPAIFEHNIDVAPDPDLGDSPLARSRRTGGH